MASQFLFNGALWHELETRIPKAKKVRAAVAYLGTGGATLLPLRKGDALIVDMSLARVRAGATDPKEVRKLLKRGVSVFSRGTLHAKFLVIDNIVIAGSSNVSNHAKNYLDEAAVLTTDVSTVQRARTTFEKLCTEPIRKNYLAKCIEEYVPPKFTGVHARPGWTKKSKKVVQSKLWFVAGLRYRGIPEDEEPKADAVVKKASERLLDFENCEVDYSHYSAKQAFFASLREGDWLIQCVRDAKGYDVWPPARFMGIESYPRGGGKRRYLLLAEKPLDTAPTRWTRLRGQSPVPLPGKPRTLPVAADADADALLRLWNARGKFKASRRK